METLIDVHGLNYGYGTGMLIKNIDFQLQRRDFTGIIGPNGSGKSTFLKLLLKLIGPAKGSIKLFGVPLEEFKQWSKIGYVAQKNRLVSGLPASVFEVVAANLYAQASFLHWITDNQKQKVFDALKTVDMLSYAKAPVHILSGGQLQRVYLAQVLVNDPEILILDEPATGMDAQSETGMYELLHKLNLERDVSVIMVTHDLTAVTNHVNRLYCMGEGTMTEHDISDTADKDFITGLYGRDVRLHVHA